MSLISPTTIANHSTAAHSTATHFSVSHVTTKFAPHSSATHITHTTTSCTRVSSINMAASNTSADQITTQPIGGLYGITAATITATATTMAPDAYSSAKGYEVFAALVGLVFAF